MEGSYLISITDKYLEGVCHELGYDFSSFNDFLKCLLRAGVLINMTQAVLKTLDEYGKGDM